MVHNLVIVIVLYQVKRAARTRIALRSTRITMRMMSASDRSRIAIAIGGRSAAA
jgi:hypothetical protein